MWRLRSASDKAWAEADTATARTIRMVSGNRRVTSSARDGIFLQHRKREFARFRARAVGIQLERKLKVRGLVTRKRDRVHPCVAGRAVLRRSAGYTGRQSLETQIGDAVRVNILADLLERMGCPDQFRSAWRIDPIETGRH